eukprot:49721-Amphidinium_carterae.1
MGWCLIAVGVVSDCKGAVLVRRLRLLLAAQYRLDHFSIEDLEGNARADVDAKRAMEDVPVAPP